MCGIGFDLRSKFTVILDLGSAACSYSVIKELEGAEENSILVHRDSRDPKAFLEIDARTATCVARQDISVPSVLGTSCWTKIMRSAFGRIAIFVVNPLIWRDDAEGYSYKSVDMYVRPIGLILVEPYARIPFIIWDVLEHPPRMLLKVSGMTPWDDHVKRPDSAKVRNLVTRFVPRSREPFFFQSGKIIASHLRTLGALIGEGLQKVHAFWSPDSIREMCHG